MYDYRKWNESQKLEAVAERASRRFPLHQPPHVKSSQQYRIITGTCFEHKRFLDSPDRLEWFQRILLDSLESASFVVEAWIVLPNHYHLLVKVPELKPLAKLIGQIHGRTSFEMNRLDQRKGRKIWYQYTDRVMRSDRHYYTTINYLHHNPVKHGYVDKQNDWQWSSFHQYTKRHGRDWLLGLWRDYPVRDYGAKWDV
jgi:putative transposase